MSETTTETPAAETEVAETEATEAEPTTANTEKVDGEDALGDKGKKALDAMKAERKKAQDEARELRTELDRIRAEADGRKAEFEAEQKARELEQSALNKANERILKAEMRAAAAAKLADPADALRFIDLSGFEVGSDGEVDAQALNTAIDDLVASKPYLAAQGKRFQGTADGGARNDASKPSQLSKSDLQGMSPDQINEARASGRLDDLLGVRK